MSAGNLNGCSKPAKAELNERLEIEIAKGAAGFTYEWSDISKQTSTTYLLDLKNMRQIRCEPNKDRPEKHTGCTGCTSYRHPLASYYQPPPSYWQPTPSYSILLPSDPRGCASYSCFTGLNKDGPYAFLAGTIRAIRLFQVM